MKNFKFEQFLKFMFLEVLQFNNFRIKKNHKVFGI